MERYIKTDILAKLVFDKWQECDELKRIIPAIQKAIMYESTADVVKVVRCMECKHRDTETGFCEGRGWPMQLVPDDGFCDKGKRIEENE